MPLRSLQFALCQGLDPACNDVGAQTKKATCSMRLTAVAGLFARREAPLAEGARALQDGHLVRGEGHCDRGVVVEH